MFAKCNTPSAPLQHFLYETDNDRKKNVFRIETDEVTSRTNGMAFFKFV